MTVKDRATLISDIETDIADNQSGDVSPADVRINMVDLVESATFPEDSGETVQIVQSLDDLPAPVSGVITLETNILYRVSGIVDIGVNRIDVDGSAGMFGYTTAHDGIACDNAGAMFTMSAGGTMRLENLVLNNINASGSLFACQGSNTEFAILRNLRLEPAAGGIGTFADVAGINISRVNAVNATGGITLSNVAAPTSGFPIFLLNDSVINISSGVFLDMGTSRWASFVVRDIPALVAGGGSTFLSGAASSANFTDGFGQIENCDFSGDGAYVSGVTNKDLRWRFEGNTGNKGTGDSATLGELAIERNATNTVITNQGETGDITAFADAGGGQVTVTSAGHGLTAGDTVWIVGTSSYDGEYIIANDTANTFEITATFVASETGNWETYWTDLGGITTLNPMSSKISSANPYELTIDNLTPVPLDVTATLSVVLAGGGTKDLEFALFINGARAFGSLVSVRTKGDETSITMKAIANLDNGDTIKIMGRNVEDATDILIVNANLVAV